MRTVSSPVASGTVFASVLFARLWTVDEYFWVARDDAVITLSHARNLADFGTIGVSPGGDRVEGFSSPLQFGLAFVVESFSSTDPRMLSIVLMVPALVLAGLMVGVTLRHFARDFGLSVRASDTLAIVLAGAIAGAVACSWTATGWLGSGMENAWLIAGGVTVVAAVSASTPSGSDRMLAALGLFGLSIGRVEFAAFTPPLILATGWALARSEPPGRRHRAVSVVVAAPLLGCVILHLARRVYFGEWLPNTAVVQGRSDGLEQMFGWALILAIGFAMVVALGLADIRLPEERARQFVSAGVSSFVVVGLAALVWLSASGRTAAPVRDLVLFPPLLPILAVVGVLLRGSRILGLRPWPYNSVFASLLLVPMAQYVVMGPARLDSYRVLSIVVPFGVLWAAILVLRLRTVAPSCPSTSRADTWPLTASAVVVVAMFAVGTVWSASNDRPRYLNYAISGTDRVLAAADSVRIGELESIGLPLLANPDLGKVSFAKRAIMTDLGLLGDPLLTRVVVERNDLMPRFLAEVAHPDVVEVHGGFSCAYGPWLASQGFGAVHRSPDETWQGALDAGGCFLGGRTALWFRTDAEEEYALTRAVLESGDPVPTVADALAACARSAGDVFRCEGVGRSVQRATQALRERGRLDDVIDAFAVSPSAGLARPMLRRGPGWADDAFVAFVGLINLPSDGGRSP